MASLQSLSLTSCHSSTRVSAALHIPNLKKVRLFMPKLNSINLPVLLEALNHQKELTSNRTAMIDQSSNSVLVELYMILEVVSDRIEMHKNMCDQRNNWNTLLLNSVNMIILTATTISGLSATATTSTGAVNGSSFLALKLSSFLLFSISTGLLHIMNKIQPSQLVEEQRNATRLFTQIQGEIKTILAVRHPTKADVKVMMGKILALDKAYPLPLLGAMLEKLPQKFEPAKWWPEKANFFQDTLTSSPVTSSNGWNESLEKEMREIVKVIKTKDTEDYIRLGSIALKVSKVLATVGPILTSMAAIASPFVGINSSAGSFAAIVAMAAGALASVVTVLEHGGQVGMVFEMYRNNAGFFGFLEESIQSTLDEPQLEKRENGEIFEMKVALKLGRSLSQLRNLAKNSGCTNKEFASKLF